MKGLKQCAKRLFNRKSSTSLMHKRSLRLLLESSREQRRSRSRRNRNLSRVETSLLSRSRRDMSRTWEKLKQKSGA